MTVRIGTPLQRPAAQAGFDQALGDQLQGKARDARLTLISLKGYIRPNNGPLREGNIRLINTTNAKELAFAYKSFGWGPQYRKDRTAQALVGLLQAAGVADAKAKVDALLKPGQAAYATLSAATLDQLLSDAEVMQALAGKPQAKQAPDSSVQLQAQAPVDQPPVDQQPVNQQPVDHPPQALHYTDRKLKDAFTDFKPRGFGELLRNPDFVAAERKPTFFTAVHKDGRFLEFRDLSAAPFILEANARAVEDEFLYMDFRDQHPSDKGEFRAPDWLVVRDPQGSDGTPSAFRLVDRQTFTQDPRFAGQTFEVWATFTVDPSRAPSNLPPVQLPKLAQAHLAQPAKPQTPKDQALQFMEQQGYAIDRGGLGKGAFGATFLAQKQGRTEVVKLFLDGSRYARAGALKAEVMDGKRDVKKYSDFYATYLAKAGDPARHKPSVIHPSSYIVEQPGGGPDAGFATIPVAEFKQRARQAANAGAPLKCVGLVMDKAPGENLDALLKKGKGLPGGAADARRFALSGLQTLKSLNERGLIHRDIKPANLNFDASTGQVHFFDTGMMFKVRKAAADRGAWVQQKTADQQRSAELPKLGLGTPGFMHPQMTKDGKVGTQADLHSFALTLMEASFDKLYIDKVHPIKARLNTLALSRTGLQKSLMRLTGPSSNEQTRAQAQQFLRDAQNPSTMANLIMRCLEMADTHSTPPARWADRNFSNKQLQSLIDHPALKQVNRWAATT